MSYYRICPHCQAHLDPGEACDCWHMNREGTVNAQRETPVHEPRGNPERSLEKTEKTALNAANIQSGESGKGLTAHISASSVQKNEEDYK